MPPPEEDVEAPVLLEEILEQIFLRLPPDEPACLVRASLASKLWLALLNGPRFRGLYREHHSAPLMLGFLTFWPWDETDPEEGGHPAAVPVPPFVSTTRFRARVPDGGWGHMDYTAWDCRHGRVLLGEKHNAVRQQADRKLAVWDPMTGRRRELQEPGVVYSWGLYAAAVLCAVSGCDHLACHKGPFRVVHFCRQRLGADDFVAQVCSLEMCDCSKPCSDVHRAQWSDPCPGVSVGSDGHIMQKPPVLVNDALHFMLAHDGFGNVHFVEILKYDLSRNRLSLIDVPKAGVSMADASILVAMEDGSLGFAHLKRSTLFIWSRDMGSDGAASWTRRRVIDLKNLLPIRNPQKDIRLVGSVEGSDAIFVIMDLGILYKIDLKSLRQKKISNEEYMVPLIPYTSFCSPSTREG